MTDHPMRLACIGTGDVADRWLVPALKNIPGTQLWSVCGRDPHRTGAFAAMHGAAAPSSVYTDLDALLADPALEAVIIATPDQLHASQTISAARAGKHVFVEKPMATSVADARAMHAACEAAGVVLQVGYHLRWHQGHHEIVRAMDAGRIGTVRHVGMRWSYPAENANNWRAQGATGRWWSLAALGTHTMDLAWWMLRKNHGDIVALHSLCTNGILGSTRDETTTIALRFASGVTADITVSVAMPIVRQLEVYGTTGMIHAEGTLGARGGGRITINATGDLPYARQDPYQTELTQFVNAIRDPALGVVGGEDGIRNVELLELAEQDGWRERATERRSS
ncbi:Gfo/Idh/MocA family oxidoreductase [Candidatus Uhrbacteria bacterium]|nr:Gfo/Idh/MocA family oxidoreductase [Candidatus Uhrbacteria bacterium]